jgi:hypothetical protein
MVTGEFRNESAIRLSFTAVTTDASGADETSGRTRSHSRRAQPIPLKHRVQVPIQQ